VSKTNDIARLEGHIPEPVVKNAVLAHIRALGAPFVLKEVYQPLGLHTTVASRVLLRLHARGVLTRSKIMDDVIGLHGICKKAVWLYSLAEGYE
jgi:hypothetical protein